MATSTGKAPFIGRHEFKNECGQSVYHDIATDYIFSNDSAAERYAKDMGLVHIGLVDVIDDGEPVEGDYFNGDPDHE